MTTPTPAEMKQQEQDLEDANISIPYSQYREMKWTYDNFWVIVCTGVIAGALITIGLIEIFGLS